MMNAEVDRKVQQATAETPKKKPQGPKTKVKKDFKKMTGMEYMRHISGQSKGFI